MKILVNGGLNLSELDGWWAEAYSPETGWALGDGREHHEPEHDAVEATRLYEILEQQVIPEFYERDRAGVPKNWLKRIRASMARLTPQFSSNRMVREYVERLYLPASGALRRRIANDAKLARELEEWQSLVREGWAGVRFGDVQVMKIEEHWHVEAQVYSGDLDPNRVQVELYADPPDDTEPPTRMVDVSRRSDPWCGQRICL